MRPSRRNANRRRLGDKKSLLPGLRSLPDTKLLLFLMVVVLYHPATMLLALKRHLLSSAEDGPSSAVAASLERSLGAPRISPPKEQLLDVEGRAVPDGKSRKPKGNESAAAINEETTDGGGTDADAASIRHRKRPAKSKEQTLGDVGKRSPASIEKTKIPWGIPDGKSRKPKGNESAAAINEETTDGDGTDADAAPIRNRKRPAKSKEQILGDVGKRSPASIEKTKMPYAIMWIIGGIHEDRPSYKGFLYDVLVSARILDRQGSRADRILWVQLSPDSNQTALAEEDLRPLGACRVQVRYFEKDDKFESFGLLVYKKFHAIRMVEYRRVMFLDADLIPTVNMDYLFHLSDPEHTRTATILRPNFIMATRGEPCNTAFFVVEPNLDRYHLLQRAIERQHDAGSKIPYPHFSKEDGWGHNFMKAGDAWRSIHKSGVRWKFHASHSDQGLMYYYAKYLIQDMSIAIGDALEHWGPPTNGSDKGKDYLVTLPKLLSVDNGTLTEHSPNPIVWQNSCNRVPKAHWQCPAPYNNLAHFPGDHKPWMRGHKGFAPTNFTEDQDAAYRLWFRTLDELSQELSMGLDVENWNAKHVHQMATPSLGHLANHRDLAEHVYNRQPT